MRILFDTNVVLDVLLDREPYSSTAAKLFSKVESGKISGYVCATTITTIHYLASRVIGVNSAVKEISNLMKLFEVAPVNRAVLEAAVSLGFKDFEDAVLHESARYREAQGIVTRDLSGFKKSKIQVYSPEELLLMLESKDTSES
ncbi:PIN domain protein [Olavius sp. associated proteobacterium Delta 1]|nr:PIN domain protein [Olavius sp. associated proteobacterium Delta 1]